MRRRSRQPERCMARSDSSCRREPAASRESCTWYQQRGVDSNCMLPHSSLEGHPVIPIRRLRCIWLGLQHHACWWGWACFLSMKRTHFTTDWHLRYSHISPSCLKTYFDINEANIRHKVKHTKVKVDHHRHRYRHSSTSIEINVTLSRHVPLPLACKYRLHLLHALAINIFPVFASKIWVNTIGVEKSWKFSPVYVQEPKTKGHFCSSNGKKPMSILQMLCISVGANHSVYPVWFITALVS